MPATDETPPTLADAGEEPSPGSLRGLAALLALALAFAAAVLISLAVQTADQPTRDDCLAGCTEYFDGGSAQKATSVALLGLGGGLGVAGVLICLAVAASGAGSRWMLPVTGAAIVIGAIGVVVLNV